MLQSTGRQNWHIRPPTQLMGAGATLSRLCSLHSGNWERKLDLFPPANLLSIALFLLHLLQGGAWRCASARWYNTCENG